MPEKKIMGLKKPVFFLAIVMLLALLAVGLFVDVEKPSPELPAEEVFSIGSFAITNTMITAWISTLVLVGVFWAATRKIKLIPGRLQAGCEIVLEWIYNLCKDAVGEKNGRRFFPLIVTIFLFVIVNAWMNLLPGYGAILITNSHGEEVHLLRGANTDFNIPAMLAMVSFAAVTFWGFQSQRLNFLKPFFNYGKLGRGFKQIFTGKFREGASNLGMGFIDAFVGFIELISYFIRIISFTFRLFGNMTGGEIVLLMIVFLIPFVFADLFYLLELLIGFVQALIFAGLTLSFAAIAVTSHSEEH